MSSDPFGEMFGAALIFSAVIAGIAAIVMIGLFMIPVVAVGAGVIYYVRNVHAPRARAAELEVRTRRLYEDAKRLSPPKDDIIAALHKHGIEDDALWDLADTLYEMEGLREPDPPPSVADSIAAARYRDELQKYISNARPGHAKKFTDQLVRTLSWMQGERDAGALFQSRRNRTPAEIEHLIMEFVNDDGIFAELRRRLEANLEEQKGVFPRDCKHDDYAWRYLKGTPLLPFDYVEQSVSLRDRLYHTYLLGSSGSGKTNLIENIIAHDLQSDEDCCIVVIDSQTQLTGKLARLDIPGTTYITPEWNLALNLFDVGYGEMKAEGIEGETLINKTVGLISFAMEGMMGASFTNPQKTIFQYAIQLVISIPGGNIFTFMDILADDGHRQYDAYIARFDANTRRFFERDFGSDEYKRSREAIRRRLDSLLLNPTFRRLFSATENRFDMFTELRDRRLILIDTNKPLLDNDASAFFGRLFIAMIVRASHMRFKRGTRDFRPVYLIVDEAHEYFDSSISDMLEQARKANIGLIVAHQSLSQAKGNGGRNIADPLMVNTATKIIWTAYREDAAKFASNMRIKADDILALPQFTFGYYHRKDGFAPIRGKPDALAKLPRRESLRELQDAMEDRYGPSETNEGGPMDDDRSWQQTRGSSRGNGSKPPPPRDDDLPDVEMI